MKCNVIHTADVHLDSPFSGLKESAAAVRQEDIRVSFSKVIQMAKNADMLFISGDLFDGRHVTRTTLDFLKKQFATIPETLVFLCAGNHDPYVSGGVYETFDFGGNVHVFGTEPERVETKFGDVYGVSFLSANDSRALLPRIKVQDTEKLNMLVMHGNTLGEGYNPVMGAQLSECGMDYVALGHVHKQSGLMRAGDTYYAYPGCPEGRGFDETGEKGVLRLAIEKGAVSAEFVPVQERIYVEEAIDISGLDSYEEIMERVKTVFCGENHIYRILLRGETSFPFETAVIEEKLSAFSVSVRDETVPATDLEKLRTEFSLKGLFVKYAMEEKETVSTELYDAALKTGLAMIEKEERNENR